MSINKNAITFGAGFNISLPNPIDSRMVVDNINDLTTVWDKDAPAYIGMVVSVKETGDIYVLTGGENVVDINNYAKDINNWKKQITDLPNMEDYVTDDELKSALSGKQDTLTAGDNITIVDNNISVDLSSKQDVISNLDEIISGAALGATALQQSDLTGYVTETELESKGYLTEHQDLSGYVKTDALTGYVTETELEGKGYVTDGELNTALLSKQDTLTAGTNISIDNNVISAFIDFSNYYTIPQIDGLIKGIEDLIGDVNSLMGDILGS